MGTMSGGGVIELTNYDQGYRALRVAKAPRLWHLQVYRKR